MKNVVVGIFDRVEDAERIIAQITASPLDLEAIQVVHANPDAQRRLAEAAGLPPRSALRNGAVIGALFGAALGFAAGWGGSEAILPGAGPLLAMAAGAFLGLIVGALAGALSENLNVPEGQAGAVLDAIRAGATAITVRTASLPTARALAEAFREAGSRMLDDAMATAEAATFAGPAAAPRAPLADAGQLSSEGPALALGPTAVKPADQPDPNMPDAHRPFAPPWRREASSEAPADAAPATPTPPPVPAASAEPAAPATPSAKLGHVLFPEAGQPKEIRRGETITSPDQSTQQIEPVEAPRPVRPAPTEAESQASAPEPVAATEAAPDVSPPAKADEPKPSPEPEVASPTSLLDLQLASRTLGALERAGIADLDALQQRAAGGPAELRQIAGIGPKAAGEILTRLEDAGIELATPPPAAHTPARASSKPAAAKKPVVRMPRKSRPELKPVESAARDILKDLFGGLGNKR